MRVPCKNIPTYNHDTKDWSVTSFNTQKEFGEFLLKECFRNPGEYNFSCESWKPLVVLGEFWEKNKYYTNLVENTKDWREFWDNEERKCRLGVIWKDGGVIRYLTRDYYFLLNFCPIINKEKGQEEAMIIFRDVQYHMMLYEKIAECFHLHSAVLKRRQMAFSNCHVAKSLNFLWFENKKTIKWMAYDESFIDDVNGSWKFFNGYVNHLKKYTAWDKILSPESFPEVQQKEKIKVQGRWLTDGNESTLVAKTLKKDPKKGIGGPAFWIWYEEGGVAPTANITLQYLNSNLESGIEKVGSFCIGGSVGDLKECKPLQNMILDPDTYEMFGVPTLLYDESGIEKICGLFIPAQYGMPQAVDEHGNSDVEKALKLLDEAEIQWKKLPEPEYILRKSQNPRTIKEAFAYRETSKFPIRKIEKRQAYLKDLPITAKELGVKVELTENDKGEVSWKMSDKEDIGYPINPKSADKTGVVIMYETPDPKYRYYAGVDNIATGTTFSSDSVFSIYILKGVSEVIYKESDQLKTRTEGIKIVSSWTGRFDSVDETNDYAIMLIKLYNAKTLAERNRENFINRCIQKGIAVKYLMKEKELPFNKEMDFSKEYTNDEYGVFMDSTRRKHDLFDDYVINFFNEELDAVYKKDEYGNYTSEKVKTFYGVEKINDFWLLEECKYVGKENTDRENAFRLALVAAKTFEIQGVKTRVFDKSAKIEKKVVTKRPFSLLQSHTIKQNKKRRLFSLLN